MKYTNKFKELLEAVRPVMEGYRSHPLYYPNDKELRALKKAFESADRFIKHLEEDFQKFKNETLR